jgi:cell division protein FtsQ
MRPLMRWRRRTTDTPDPAPSRWRYRVQRLWLTPLFRAAVRTGLPVCLIGGSMLWYVSDLHRLEGILDQASDIRRAVEERPEFMITRVSIDGASDELTLDIQEVLPIDVPVSQFAIDIKQIKASLEQLDPVKSADVRIKPGGLLTIDVLERTPAIVWRAPEAVELLAADGHRVTAVASASARPDLPQVAGLGAQDHIPEALRLFRAMQPIADRVVGLQRIGARRWDVVLQDDVRIMLPPENPKRALDQAMALHAAQDVLNRDIVALDYRNDQRPTLRMSVQARTEWRRIKDIQLLASEQSR